MSMLRTLVLLCTVLSVFSCSGEKKAGCFALVLSLLLCGHWCSFSLPRGALGWFAVCGCGISLTYYFTFYFKRYVM